MLNRFLTEEQGGMSIEAAIITAALVALAITFRKQLGKLWDAAGGKMKDMEKEIKES